MSSSPWVLPHIAFKYHVLTPLVTFHGFQVPGVSLKLRSKQDFSCLPSTCLLQVSSSSLQSSQHFLSSHSGGSEHGASHLMKTTLCNTFVTLSSSSISRTFPSFPTVMPSLSSNPLYLPLPVDNHHFVFSP